MMESNDTKRVWAWARTHAGGAVPPKLITTVVRGRAAPRPRPRRPSSPPVAWLNTRPQGALEPGRRPPAKTLNAKRWMKREGWKEFLIEWGWCSGVGTTDPLSGTCPLPSLLFETLWNLRRVCPAGAPPGAPPPPEDPCDPRGERSRLRLASRRFVACWPLTQRNLRKICSAKEALGQAQPNADWHSAHSAHRGLLDPGSTRDRAGNSFASSGSIPGVAIDIYSRLELWTGGVVRP
eukprot:gene14603-biopygen12649